MVSIVPIPEGYSWPCVECGRKAIIQIDHGVGAYPHCRRCTKKELAPNGAITLLEEFVGMIFFAFLLILRTAPMIFGLIALAFMCFGVFSFVKILIGG